MQSKYSSVEVGENTPDKSLFIFTYNAIISKIYLFIYYVFCLISYPLEKPKAKLFILVPSTFIFCLGEILYSLFQTLGSVTYPIFACLATSIP